MLDDKDHFSILSTSSSFGKLGSPDFPSQASSIYRREPTLAEIESVQHEIHAHGCDIAAIDADISRLQREIALLRQQRARHEEAVKKCKGAITLARRIPPELLAYIFELCAQEGWSLAPVVVSQVCSAWRMAAKAPNVWSHLYVNCDDYKVISRTRFWLSNALHAALHVTIRATTVHRTYIDILRLLESHIAQLKVLRISSPRRLVTEGIMAWFNDNSAPLLESVTVEVDEATNDEASTGAIPFSNAPSLRTFTLSSPSMQPLGSLPSQIVNLHINLKSMEDTGAVLSVQAILSAVASLPTLKIFKLTISATSFSAIHLPQDPTPISSGLETVTLEASPAGWVLLDYLHLPHLRRLHLLSLPETSLGYPDAAAGALLKRFLVNSTPPLETLELYDIDLSDSDFCSCFSLLGSLRDLRLHSSDISDATLSGLRGHNGWCPELRRLDLRWCGTLTGRALVDLVRSRSAADMIPHGPPVEEITVIHCAFVGEEDVLELARLTTCRVVHRNGDHLPGHRGCCDNARYRQRLRLRHLKDFMSHYGSSLRLVI
ncbi:hypothetical protein PUNSTDRAFT_125437 [Punctularia strigosozonata HHB-11173 SS5]|uniref:uncharacterized protein n=1 Tax=Punctularia strigosozonata (strain HHB-11173) TaxID=741275 RepID=UPI0004417B22|nr:uncharacterized protein PUNSTDRAFT_125437 [Punctularia strigosozonata HHB-11173 SS5]EIN10720.1 hypothetical protein PUNSTDRAFT_125437 [Punctularia strigosozonata HHB-11173 SS5]